MLMTFKNFSLESETLPKEASDYLLEYGFKQSMQDAVAGVAKKALDEGKTEAEANTLVEEALAKRFEAIRLGEVAVRSVGPRLKGIDKLMAEVAEAELKAAFGKKGLKWPSGKGSAEAIAELRTKYIAKFEAKVRKEAERRLKLQATAEEFSLDDILAT